MGPIYSTSLSPKDLLLFVEIFNQDSQLLLLHAHLSRIWFPHKELKLMMHIASQECIVLCKNSNFSFAAGKRRRCFAFSQAVFTTTSIDSSLNQRAQISAPCLAVGPRHSLAIPYPDRLVYGPNAHTLAYVIPPIDAWGSILHYKWPCQAFP